MNEKEERMVRESIEAAVKEFLLKDEKKPLIAWRFYMIDGSHVGRAAFMDNSIDEFLRTYYNFHQEMFAIVVSKPFAITWASKFGSDIKDFGDRYIFFYEEIRPVGMRYFQAAKADPWDKWIEEGTKAEPVKPSDIPTPDDEEEGFFITEKDKKFSKTIHTLKRMLEDMANNKEIRSVYVCRFGGENYKVYNDGVPCEEPGCIYSIIPCKGCGRYLAQGTASKLLEKKEDK